MCSKLNTKQGECVVTGSWEHLKRNRIKVPEGIFVMPSPGYTEKILKILVLENCTPASTLHLSGDSSAESPGLVGPGPTTYRSATCCGLYFSIDRTDVQGEIIDKFAAELQTLTEYDMQRFVKLAKHWKGRRG